MKMHLALVGSLVALTLSACSGGTSSNDPFGSDSHAQGDGGAQKCGVVFDKNDLQNSGLSLPAVVGDYVVMPSAETEHCETTTAINGATTSDVSDGYPTLVAYRKASPVDQYVAYTIDNADTFLVKVRIDVPTDDQKKAIAVALHGRMDRYQIDSIQIMPALPTYGAVWITLSDGRTGSAQVQGIQEGGSQLLVRLDHADSSNARTVERLNRGDLTLKFYAQVGNDYAPSNVLAVTQFTPNAGSLASSIALAAPSQLILEIWDAASQDLGTDRTHALESALMLVREFPSADYPTSLAKIYRAADFSWSPVPQTFDDANWQAETLTFLNILNPSHPTARIYAIFTALNDGATDMGLSLSRAVWLAQNSGLSEDQRNAVLDAYRALRSSQLPYADPWAKAQDLCVKTGYAADGIKGMISNIREVYEWVNGYEGPSITDTTAALAQSELIALRPDFSDAKFSSLREAYEWLTSYSGVSMTDHAQALETAKTYVFNQQLTSLGLAREAFEWLTSYSGPSITDHPAARLRMENYLFVRKMTESMLDQLRSRFDAHYSETYDRTKALVAAERDVFGNNSL